MKVLVSGSHGLIGSAVIPSLIADGHQVGRLIRAAATGRGEATGRRNAAGRRDASPPPGALRTGGNGPSGNAGRSAEPASNGPAGVTGRSAVPASNDACWDPLAGTIDATALEGVDAVVHLAGTPIGEGRWTPRRKTEILLSRTRGTSLLADAIRRCARPPAFLCASAAGYYGSRGDEVATEETPPGRGFLANVARQWEEAAVPARATGGRVVHLRLGVVVSPRGGALARLLPLFRLGLGARFGDGRQWMSWIALAEIPEVLRFLLERPDLDGPFNLTAPSPVTNADFTRALARSLSRSARLAIPGIALRLLLGEMADEMLLSGARVLPARLLSSGYRFRYPDLDRALKRPG